MGGGGGVFKAPRRNRDWINKKEKKIDADVLMNPHALEPPPVFAFSPLPSQHPKPEIGKSHFVLLMCPHSIPSHLPMLYSGVHSLQVTKGGLPIDTGGEGAALSPSPKNRSPKLQAGASEFPACSFTPTATACLPSETPLLFRRPHPPLHPNLVSAAQAAAAREDDSHPLKQTNPAAQGCPRWVRTRASPPGRRTQLCHVRSGLPAQRTTLRDDPWRKRRVRGSWEWGG